VAGTNKFDAFISYRQGQEGDTGIAQPLQERLQRFGRPWHNLRRPLRVFLDTRNLAFSSDAWTTVVTALQDTTWLILIATPASAASVWVRREVAWWVENRSLDQLIIVHGAGVIRWNPVNGRFADCTDALPPRLLAEVMREPLWVSLVPEDEPTHPPTGSPELTAMLETATARISAGMRGMSLDEVSGAHLRQRRLAQRAMAGATAVTTAFAVAASVAGVGFYVQRDEAREQRDQAVSRQLATQASALRDTDPALARQFGLAAYETSPTVEARGQLLSSASMPPETRMLDHTGATYASVASTDGHLLVTAGADGYASVWDVGVVTGPELLSQIPVDANGVFTVALSTNARTLATGDYDGAVGLWDLSDLRHPVNLSTIAAHRGRVAAVSFSPDGGRLASGGEDGVARLWTVADPHRPVAAGDVLTGHTRGVSSVAFAPDGCTLATGSRDRTVRLWRVTDPMHVELTGPPLTAHTSDVSSVVFAPDGATLATASLDGTVRLWRMAPSGTAAPAGDPLTGHTNAVYAIAFSPDGRRLASGSNDNTVRVWDPRTHSTLATLPHPLSVQTIVFLNSSDQLVSGGNDGQLRLWHLPGRTMSGGQGPLVSAVYRPDGHLAATGSVDNSVQLWDLTDPDHPDPVGAPLLGHVAAIARMAFRSDGRLLAVPSDDHTITLWDVGDPHQPRLLGSPLDGHQLAVTSVAFSPDGRLLVSGSVDGSVRLWDVTDPTHAAAAAAPLTDRQGAVIDVDISPDGRTLAAAGGDGSTWLYDLSDPRRPSLLGDPLGGHRQSVLAVQFSDDGHTLATAGEDGIIWLWDLTDRRRPVAAREPLRDSGGAVIDVTLGPDGQLAAASSDGSIRLWDTRPHQAVLQARLVGHRAAVYSIQFAPDGRHLLSGSADATAVVWDTSTDGVRRDICASAGIPPTGDEWTANAPGVVLPVLCP
jgi:WD40 repeat protein